MMDDQKITLEDLRKLLNQNAPVWLMTETIGPATVNTWHVVAQLLDYIEAQDVRIKSLEDQIGPTKRFSLLG